jgi:Kelch motif
VGGYDSSTSSAVKFCSRYNIVTEKWQQLSLTIFEKMDASACAINEYNVVLVGGINTLGRPTDLVEIYDVRENTWKLFEIGLSSPRRLMAMVSS